MKRIRMNLRVSPATACLGRSGLTVKLLILGVLTLGFGAGGLAQDPPSQPKAVPPNAGQPASEPADTERPDPVKLEPTAGTAATPRAEERPISYWLERLDSDQFAQRQAATLRLTRLGLDAVEPLVEVTQSGKLELTQRAVNILQTLASDQPPDSEDGAWGGLERIASQGGGAAAMAAKQALDDIRRQRQVLAYERLSAAGVQIGFRDFVLHSRSLTNQEAVWIDKKWKGDVDALRWLRWVHRVDHVLIEGEAVRREVLEQVVRMPAVRTIVLRDATVRDDIFEPLATLPRIDDLELRYIRLNLEDADKLAALPIRVSLGLMGTGLPVEGADKIRRAIPGLNLIHKQGGFLGVVCNNLTPRCEITAVKPNGAAANAGIQPGDVVVRINETPIATFEDLQQEIGSHLPGDEVEITFDRFGEIEKVKLRLGRLEGE